MKKYLLTVAAAMLLNGCAGQYKQSITTQQGEPKIKHTASDVITKAAEDEWRVVNSQNILKITLPTGATYIELNPQLAPQHVKNIKKLARESFYQGTSVYRFVEGFVAQGGASSAKKIIKTANKSLLAEFYLTTKQPLAITALEGDGYAPITGFLNGFAVAQNALQTQTWQVHCSGIFAMARNNDINSASTEFFITIGQAPRYLDKNTTVFGRVLEGIEHVNRLERTARNDKEFNPITDIQVLEDINNSDKSVFKVMKTNSQAFKNLIAARKNRSEPWFVHTANYIDVCAVAIPTKRSE